MWQRVQTLYLAVAAVLLTFLLFGDVATVMGPGGETLPVEYRSKLPYLVLICLALASGAVALFSFRKRMFQLRMTAVSMVVSLGLQGWLVYDYFSADSQFVFSWTAVFPIVCVIFDFLAIRGIFADELMVRSSSRLRSAKRNRK